MSNDVQMIPIDRIRILNPRHRDRKKFAAIIQSIQNLGLKKPIQVSMRARDEAGGPGYDLVCGQGRIEAFTALGYKKIPAIVVEVSKEERLLRSLVENIARRNATPLELLREIERLKARGYSNNEIGQKLDIGATWVCGLVALSKAGEERLLEATIKGKIPLTVAIEVAKADSAETQRELLRAYESKQMKEFSVRTVKRLIAQRRTFGKGRDMKRTGRTRLTSAESLVTAFKREGQRQKLLIRKAKLCEAKLVFIVTAFSKLLADVNFVTLLRAEGLTAMPKCLWEKAAAKWKEAA